MSGQMIKKFFVICYACCSVYYSKAGLLFYMGSSSILLSFCMGGFKEISLDHETKVSQRT